MSTSNSSDKRIRRTKNIFKRTLIELIKEEGYRNVTVTDIIQRAEYNRSTFYLHYQDKEELAEELMGENFAELTASFRKPFLKKPKVVYDHIMPSSNTFFQHIYDNREFYTLLNVEDTLPGLKERFLLSFKSIFSGLVYYNEHKEPIRLKYFNTYKMYGSYGVILEWIEEGCKTSPDEFSQHLLEIFKANEQSFQFQSTNQPSPEKNKPADHS